MLNGVAKLSTTLARHRAPRVISELHCLYFAPHVDTTRDVSPRLVMLPRDTPALFACGRWLAIWERDYLKRESRLWSVHFNRCNLCSKVESRAFGSAGQPDLALRQVAERRFALLEQRRTGRTSCPVARGPDLADGLTVLDLHETQLTIMRGIITDLRRWFCVRTLQRSRVIWPTQCHRHDQRPRGADVPFVRRRALCDGRIQMHAQVCTH